MTSIHIHVNRRRARDAGRYRVIWSMAVPDPSWDGKNEEEQFKSGPQQSQEFNTEAEARAFYERRINDDRTWDVSLKDPNGNPMRVV